jgi:hypothetical protein
VKNPIRNEASLVLVVAVVFSGIAIPVLSGFLEPSQPPAVAAVQIGTPGDDAGDVGAPGKPTTERPPAERRRPAPRPAAPQQPAPSAPADDAAEDDGGEAD